MTKSFYSFAFTFGLFLWAGISNSFAQNTYYGTGAGTGGTWNTHLGYYAGSVSTAIGNTFVGDLSGYSTTDGAANTFMGASAGRNNTTGSTNVFIGSNTGEKNTTGSANTLLGLSAGRYNTSGSYNTFLGQYSGNHNTTGQNNTYIGRASGHDNTIGSNNVYIGYHAGYRGTDSDKLIIDNADDTRPLIFGDFRKNSVGIGYKYTGSNYKLYVQGKVRATAYDVASDKRLKQDIHPLENALTKVRKVEGVSYLLKDNFLNEQPSSEQRPNLSDLNASSADQPATKESKPVYYGFVAQDIQKVFPELVSEEEGILSVNYMGMIPILVEALKELTQERDGLLQRNAQMEERLAAVEQALNLKNPATQFEKSTGSLLQNRPNPFGQSTSITYQVATDARQVSMIITNLNGMEVKRYNNLAAGAGQVEISAGSLPNGTYIYTLVADGQQLSSQRMIIAK